MTTQHERILQTVSEELALACLQRGEKVWRTRPTAFKKESLPIVAVMPVSIPMDVTDNAGVDCVLGFRVVLLTAGGVPEQTADPLVETVFATVMGSRKTRDLVIDLLPAGITFSDMEGDEAIGVTEFVFNASYRTKMDSLADYYQ